MSNGTQTDYTDDSEPNHRSHDLCTIAEFRIVVIGYGNDRQILRCAYFVVEATTLPDRYDPVAVDGDHQHRATDVADGIA